MKRRLAVKRCKSSESVQEMAEKKSKSKLKEPLKMAELDDKDRDRQLITGLIGPLLIFLRLSGLPVPSVCTHRCSAKDKSGRNIDKRQEKLETENGEKDQTGKIVFVNEFPQTELKQQQQLIQTDSTRQEQEPNEKRVNMTGKLETGSNSSDMKDNSCLEGADGCKKQKHPRLVTVRSLDSGVFAATKTRPRTVQPYSSSSGSVSERSRQGLSKKKQPSLKHTGLKTHQQANRDVKADNIQVGRMLVETLVTRGHSNHCDEHGNCFSRTQKPVSFEADLSRPADPKVGNALPLKQTDSSSSVCRKCLWQSRGSRVLNVIFLLVISGNAFRYTTVFFTVSLSGFQVVPFLTVQLFFMGILLLFILTMYDLNKFLPRLLESIQRYEAAYGTVVECAKLRRNISRRAWVFVVMQALVGTPFFSLQLYFFPSLRVHLAPANNSTGAVLYCAIAILQIVWLLMCAFVGAVGGIMLVMTNMLTIEFKNMTNQLRKILKSRGEVDSESGLSMDHQSDQSTRDLQLENVLDHECGHDLGCKVKLHSQKNVSCEFDLESDRSRRPDGSIGHELAEPSDNLDLDCDIQRKRDLDQEAYFDFLRFKHEALCKVVRLCNCCIRHFVVLAFSGTIPLICLTIFAMSSGALDIPNFLFQVYTMLIAVYNLVKAVIHGIQLNDVAHAPQDVIYGADWSHFSDRLLYKVQLFASRLGHCRIGYDVYGLFVIDRNTVLMVVGTLVTYTVVVLQFQTDQGTCSTGNNSTPTTNL